MSKLYFSSSLPASRIYTNQTAILNWLHSCGHKVSFVRDYFGEGRRVQAANSSAVPPITTPPTAALAVHIGKPCPYCINPMEAGGRRQPTRDHKRPRSQGGTLGGRNKLICCRNCNEDKGSQNVEQWHHRLASRGDPRADRVGYVILEEAKGPPIRRIPTTSVLTATPDREHNSGHQE